MNRSGVRLSQAALITTSTVGINRPDPRRDVDVIQTQCAAEVAKLLQPPVGLPGHAARHPLLRVLAEQPCRMRVRQNPFARHFLVYPTFYPMGAHVVIEHNPCGHAVNILAQRVKDSSSTQP